jgi:hypothetical protein
MTTITLRRLRADLASQLDQLEAQAFVLERNSRCSIGVESAPASPPLLSSVLSAWLRIVQHTKRLLRTLDHKARNPIMADTLRVTSGSLSDAIVYLSLACGLLLDSSFGTTLLNFADPMVI